MYKLGIDVGSTTLKCVLIDIDGNLKYKSYTRHFSKIAEALAEAFIQIKAEFGEDIEIIPALSGSAGMGIAQNLGFDFIQEVYATKVAVNKLYPDCDTVIELGGEDAKILFLQGIAEIRMNGTCAGGTGAFVDQMASLLNKDLKTLNEISQNSTQIYSIASRCGVFAKTDIQPLLNQGAKHEDIAKSIFHAVANQTVGGLAQGREINGKVLYLGGPLTFFSQLRQSFDETLHIKGICPDNSLYYVAIGTAMAAGSAPKTLKQISEEIAKSSNANEYRKLTPLFKNEEEYNAFVKRHSSANVLENTDENYSGNIYIGIDAGSTTLKIVAIDEEEKILFSKYIIGSGNPVPTVREILVEIYDKYPQANIKACAVTGYGEELIKNAFSADFGIVETMAHFTAAKRFCPEVDFIIDIGGQDIKCFKIKDGVIDDIFLNEACSSGCGSFLQSFASVWGYSAQEFAECAIKSNSPVDLGSRCTVFMNSSVKEAQKNGASIENISAGLAMSVVKNALYKVMRSSNALGEHIVVQGGTFLNDAVLRAFEMEIGKETIRPAIAGMMGAYGAALYSKTNQKQDTSSLISKENLATFEHNVSSVKCNLCNNHCALTVNKFSDGRKFIGGNRCERPLQGKSSNEYNMFHFKRKLIRQMIHDHKTGSRGKIGIPLALNMVEMVPFWKSFFETLSFEVKFTEFSTYDLYLKGHHTIPSDTVCFPAKLVHGHIAKLVEDGYENIFYPCMTYNINENLGDNYYNCPVVAYYPEVISANMPQIKKVNFIYDYIGIHRKKDFAKKMQAILAKHFGNISVKEVKNACEKAFLEYEEFLKKVENHGEKIIKKARKDKRPIIVLAGRPYHIDPEINHGIDRLICSMGAAVVSEDAVSKKSEAFTVDVLNQWSYHSRLYAAANYTCTQKDMNLVQLVSFGCGIDAITTDEIRRILSDGGKICTQIKIDEITNLGAVKIRLQSLFAAMGENYEN